MMFAFAAFFRMDDTCVKYWLIVIDNLITHDKTTLKELLSWFACVNCCWWCIVFLPFLSCLHFSAYLAVARRRFAIHEQQRTRIRNARIGIETFRIHYIQFTA